MAIEQATHLPEDDLRQERIRIIQWELSALMEHKKQLELVGRDLGYYFDQRVRQLQERLDGLLGFPQPKKKGLEAAAE